MGKFVIKKTKTGFVFNVVAGNGETIATSQVYKAKTSCKKGIRSVKATSAAAEIEDHTLEDVKEFSNPKFEVYTDKSGETRFHLRARNGQIVAVSQAYKEKASAVKGIESIKKNAPDAPVVEAEPEK
ncbi:DUF1508 domain-containing protein [Clostridium sp. AN503]|uniref:YegP family protein n=1 Tax=Clostridium sp. AN503 TaxID=3160598 RepID=UPI003459C311